MRGKIKELGKGMKFSLFGLAQTYCGFFEGRGIPPKMVVWETGMLLANAADDPVSGQLPATGFCDGTNRGNQGNIAYEADHPGRISTSKSAQ